MIIELSFGVTVPNVGFLIQHVIQTILPASAQLTINKYANNDSQWRSPSWAEVGHGLRWATAHPQKLKNQRL
jgi:hypothetical protein